MAKTEVILTQYVAHLGGESDQVKVAAGYARNYLMPHGLAIPVTGANKRRLESLKQKRAERESKELNAMAELAAALSKMTLVIAMKTGDDGKLFGSVTAGTIADELHRQFEATIDKRKVHLPVAIKSLGEQEVELRLHHDVVVKLKVRVESSNPPPKVEEAPADAAKEGKRGDRGDRGDRKPRAPRGA